MSKASDQMHDLRERERRIVLVCCPHPDDRALFADREDEMHGLLKTAGCEVVATAVQYLHKPVGSSYIGSGKIEEVRQLAEANQADEVVFDVDLQPQPGPHPREVHSAADHRLHRYHLAHLRSQRAHQPSSALG